jgi:membrane fusion protein, multidrug efflux system
MTVSDEQNAVPGNGKRFRALRLVLLVCVLIGAVWLLLWQRVLSVRESTSNAYVGGHQVQVSPQVQGTVVAIHVDDTQRVSAGQLLITLESTDAEVALIQARANLALAVQRVRQMRDQAAQDAELVAARKLSLWHAKADLERREPLLDERAIAAEEVQHVRDRVTESRVALQGAERQAGASRALAGNGSLAEHPAVQAARAAFLHASIALQRTRIVAPVAGDIVQRTVQLGNRVQPGQALMRIVPLNELWVDANFKEVQLRHLRIGQPAKITVDLYGGSYTFHSRIAGFSAGTGAAFALLPPQNAAGNWVKVVQRVPVRIKLDPQQLEHHPLRVGLSAEVTVDTHDRSGPQLAPLAALATLPVEPATDLRAAEAEATRIITMSALDVASTP